MKVDDENKDARKRVTFSIYFHLFCSKLMLELWLWGFVLCMYDAFILKNSQTLKKKYW